MTPFQPLFHLSDEDLARRAARRYRVDRTPGFPDRIELRDLGPGETDPGRDDHEAPPMALAPFVTRMAILTWSLSLRGVTRSAEGVSTEARVASA